MSTLVTLKFPILYDTIRDVDCCKKMVDNNANSLEVQQLRKIVFKLQIYKINNKICQELLQAFATGEMKPPFSDNWIGIYVSNFDNSRLNGMTKMEMTYKQ